MLGHWSGAARSGRNRPLWPMGRDAMMTNGLARCCALVSLVQVLAACPARASECDPIPKASATIIGAHAVNVPGEQPTEITQNVSLGDWIAVGVTNLEGVLTEA